MAVTAQKNLSSLIQKSFDRQTSIAYAKFKFKKKQVERVLLSYIRDDNVGPYNELLKILSYPLSDENYRILLEDCMSSVMLLGRELKDFVSVLCSVEWASRGEDLIDLHSRFVLSLLTAHTHHCPRVMTCLVQFFKNDGENWEERPPEDKILIWSNIHTVLAQIVATIPMTSSLLMQTVIEQFPYHKAGCYVNRAYIHNLIWMSKYIPSLMEQIITAIVNRMIEMDVNIDRVKSNAQSETMFEMDTDDTDETSETLDYSMLEMLQWLQDERDSALKVMCGIFERLILPTYGIRHVQFLLLYTVSISQQCMDRVLSNLWTVAAGRHGMGPGALATRRAAASHLAGLLARCVRMPNTRLCRHLHTMAEWCHAYITAAQESVTATDNAKVHGAFLAICHAIFYLVAFKHQQLFSSKEHINFVESLNVARLVACPLNPLRTCPPQVTRAFSSITRAHQVAYCQPIIERNLRHSLLVSEHTEYDDWFPYDPYSLPRSGKIIWPLCVDYKDWLKHGDDETQYSGMKKRLEAEDDDFLMSASPSQKLATSLSNSISPGFKTSESVMM